MAGLTAPRQQACLSSCEQAQHLFLRIFGALLAQGGPVYPSQANRLRPSPLPKSYRLPEAEAKIVALQAPQGLCSPLWKASSVKNPSSKTPRQQSGAEKWLPGFLGFRYCLQGQYTLMLGALATSCRRGQRLRGSAAPHSMNWKGHTSPMDLLHLETSSFIASLCLTMPAQSRRPQGLGYEAGRADNS